jgi:hypothetical protein
MALADKIIPAHNQGKRSRLQRHRRGSLVEYECSCYKSAIGAAQ